MSEHNGTEDRAIVKEVRGKKIVLETMKSGACDSCAAHALCAGQSRCVEIITESDLPLKKGDVVHIEVSAGIKLFSSFIIFVFPIIIMFAAYFVSKVMLSLNENLCVLISILSLLPSMLIIRMLDKKYAKKVHFEIIEKITEEDAE